MYIGKFICKEDVISNNNYQKVDYVVYSSGKVYDISKYGDYYFIDLAFGGNGWLCFNDIDFKRYFDEFV